MKFTKKTTLGGAIKVYTDTDLPAIATFSDDVAGLAAFGFFVAGLASNDSISLYDMDKDIYLVGDVGQLAGSEA